jgi:hypothetical protein
MVFDQVCDSFAGKCVGRNDSCFSQFTCDYNGFVCKSDYDDLQAKAKKVGPGATTTCLIRTTHFWRRARRWQHSLMPLGGAF